MFDFFRDIALEISGIDSQEIEQKRRDKKELKKKNKYIFSNSTKGIIYFFGILYFFTGSTSIALSSGSSQMWFAVIKFVFLSVIDVAALVCLSMKKKKMEKIALVLIAIFVIVMYSTSMMLIY